MRPFAGTAIVFEESCEPSPLRIVTVTLAVDVPAFMKSTFER